MSGYVTRLIKAECTFGTMANYLNVETDHGVVWYKLDDKGNVSSELPLMNANDHVPDKNITMFGACSSPTNKVIGGSRSFHIGSLMDGLGAALGFTEGYPCTPICPQSWANLDKDHLLDGAPILDGKCMLTCYYGGVITISVSTQ